MHKSILVPVDGSEHSFKALDLASEMARHHKSTVKLLHVVPAKELPEGLRKWAQVEHIKGEPDWFYEKVIAENLLAAAYDRATSHGAGTVERRVEHGDPARNILAVAKQEDIDTIVMGTRGLNDFKGLFLGSVAHQVGSGAECTVVTVK